MPNRILRDWTDSETIDTLDPQAERFFVRLIMKVDDYGRYQANPKLLKSHLFPLKTDVRETDISRWMAACQKAGLIALYDVAGKGYLMICNFKQVLRQKVEKYPPPTFATHTHSIRIADATPETNPNPNPETESESEKKGARKFALVFPFGSEKFAETWKILTRQPKWAKKGPDALQMALKKLGDYDEPDAIAMMENAIAGGWQGIFPLKKNETNGKQKFDDSPEGRRNQLLALNHATNAIHSPNKAEGNY